LGGTWLASLASDLGNGKFNGAWLVQNFENLNPSNTFWTKQYELYSKIDTEGPRYLEFERWWGGKVTLNAEEIQFIVDELFVGNRLAAGEIQLSDGNAVDLRAIRSPIVVFCSKGDNITPPQQALGWLLDLYDTVDEMRSFGQTVVYTIHETAGHLGIFVSGGVARKEYGEFSSNIDLIDTLPPGLYEAVFEKKTDETAQADLVSNDWVMRCEARTLDDIRAIVGSNAEDDRRFAAAARVSEINLALYRAWLQPLVKAWTNEPAAELMRRCHPLDWSYQFFSGANPFLRWLGPSAESLKQHRRPAQEGNLFIGWEKSASETIENSLDAWRDIRDSWAECMFLTLYGSPALQAAVGIDPASTGPFRKIGKSALHRQFVERRILELKAQMTAGGLREAVIRAALYVAMARGRVDERGFEMLRRLRRAQNADGRITLTQFKAMVREQFFMLIVDAETALGAIPDLLPPEPDERAKALALLKQVLGASGALSGEAAERLERMSRLFEKGASRAKLPAAAARGKTKHSAVS
jgi:hypothetical protein